MKHLAEWEASYLAVACKAKPEEARIAMARTQEEIRGYWEELRAGLDTGCSSSGPF